MEGLENRLSQPVAFTSVPLEASQKRPTASSNSSSDTDVETPAIRNGKRAISNKLGKHHAVIAKRRVLICDAVVSRSNAGISQFPPPRLQPHTIDLKAELDEVLADDGVKPRLLSCGT
jgi:hypothetical protein